MANGIYTIGNEEIYTQIEYIQCSGTQYIDTNIIPNQNTHVIIDIYVENSITAWAGIFGTRVAGSNKEYTFFIDPTRAYSGYNSDVSINNIDVFGRYTIDKNKEITTFKDLTITHPIATFQCVNNMIIGNVAAADTQYGGLIGKIYSCQIYDNDVLIRDFIPCINSNNIIGLYDKVNKLFYTNAGTGDFTAGPVLEEITFKIPKEISKLYTINETNIGPSTFLDNDNNVYTEVEFLESSGTQYINTNFIPNQDTRIICDFELLTESTWRTPIGTWSYDAAYNKCFVFMASSGNKFTPYYGSTYKTFSTTVTTGRKTFDFNKNVCTLGDETITFTAETFTSAYPLTIFSGNTNGSSTEPATMKLYSCKIYDNDTLVRDFIPVVTSAGTSGLFDKVENIFYSNSGTGTFNFGNIIQIELSTPIKKSAKIKKGYIINKDTENNKILNLFYSTSFLIYDGEYEVLQVEYGGKICDLYRLIGSGVLKLNDDALFWMCGGGKNGNSGGMSVKNDGTYSVYGGNGGASGYLLTGEIASGENWVVTVGAGGSAASAGASSITDGVTTYQTKYGSDGASGYGAGGSYKNGGTVTKSGGKGTGESTIPFGIGSLKKHCAGGAGGFAKGTDNIGGGTAGKGGSNGSNGGDSVRGSSVSNNIGGDFGGGSTQSNATFYGGGGGGANGSYAGYSGAYGYINDNYGTGYQGVVYILDYKGGITI